MGDHLGSTSVTVFNDGTSEQVARQYYYPFGGPRPAGASALPTDRRFTGQRSEEATLGSLYDFVARPYSPRLGRFLAPDSIVPEPGNPQSLNRYSYGWGNPVKYRDPTGHAPEWLENAWSYVSGASAQYLDDVTLGAWSALVVKVDLDLIDNEAYQQGRETGRSVSTAQAEFEVATGIGAAIAGAAAAPITLGGGTLCAVGTAGLCAIPAGLALAGEGAMVVGGAATALHGGGVLLYAKGKPIGGSSKYDKLSQHDIELLKKKGYDIHILKGKKNASKYDLFKDKDGNIYMKPKDGSGPGEPLDINIYDLDTEQ